MAGYGLGECANSLIMNGFFGFAMLYYTEALKLDPRLAGIAMSVSVFWEAITEPVMGHYSDRTRNRYGRRHPWMLLGGLLMAVSFYFIWAVPTPLRGHAMPLFWYLVMMNLCLRTGLTMFFIPYLALGFEMCHDTDGKSKLQAVRQVLNMAANFAGPALAWSIFYRDGVGADGAKIIGTTVPQNFIHMGAAFSLATVAHTTQTPEAIWRLGAATFIAGPLVCVASLLAIRRYPITRQQLDSLIAKPPQVEPTGGQIPGDCRLKFCIAESSTTRRLSARIDAPRSRRQ